jgi:HEAT repeat protein
VGYLIKPDFDVLRLRRKCLHLLRDYLADPAMSSLVLSHISELRICLSEKDLETVYAHNLVQATQMTEIDSSKSHSSSAPTLSYIHQAMEEQMRFWAGDLRSLTHESLSEEPEPRFKFALAMSTAAELTKDELLDYFSDLIDAPLNLQRMAAFRLGQYPWPELIDPLKPLLKSESDEIRIEAASSIIKLLSGKKARKIFARAFS